MKRGLFIIYNKEVKIVFHDTMDHREWMESLGLDLSNFDSIVRGYIIDNKIVFFKGSMFNYDNEVYEAARLYGPRIRSMVNNDSLVVCCGIVVASAGSKWEPVVTLKESDLIKDIITKSVQTKEVVPVELGPAVEFKNDISDDGFVKKAMIVTGIVFVLNIFIVIMGISNGRIHFNNIVDLLLVVGQFLLLGYTLYSYKQKMDYSKYLGIICSFLIFLNLDLISIIVGLFYFVFNIDQNIIFNLFKKNN